MAITRDKKQTLVAELHDILAAAKMAVFAQYTGVSVKEMQELRRAARAQGVTIKVVKNRLVRVAMSQIDTLKNTDASTLKGQVLYAFSSDDEVVPAKVLAEFAKTHPALQLVGAFSGVGANLDTAETTALAALPSKNELIAQVIATLQSPVNDVVSGLNPLGSLVNALEAHAA
jgi:large subunit ribosomal protein L10